VAARAGNVKEVNVFIRNAWYVAALSAEVKEELLPRSILGERIVMFRKPGGGIAALEDRCIHRQVPLSKGKLRDGVVSCWYHGLKYDSAGKCIEIPSQEKIPPKACVRSFPIVERYGMAWIWMGEGVEPDSAAIPDHAVCDDPGFAGEMQRCFVNCNYKFGIDNILDISHAAFIHEKTLGSEDVVRSAPVVDMQPGVIRVLREMVREKVPPLYQNVMKMEFMDRTQTVNYWPVSHTRVDTEAYPHGVRDCVPFHVYTTTIFTPADEGSTHIFVGMHRDFLQDNVNMTRFITQKIKETVDEDIDVTQHLQGNWREDAPTIQLNLDKASLAARRILAGLESQETRHEAADMFSERAINHA
jgi:phenylpropionate dioxygenase-like ring-hydroxylating dioxygenase large terminal subunit